MPKFKRKVLVLHYSFHDNDFLMKRNEIRPAHLSYLRQYADQNNNKVEFKVAESLKSKKFYWVLTTDHDEILRFVQDDPYNKEGLVHDVLLYRDTLVQKY